MIDGDIAHVQPEGLFLSERFGYSQVVTSSRGRTAWIAGQTATDERGRPQAVGDIARQADVALGNLGKALAAVGAGPGDVTMLRAYVVGLDRERAGVIAPRVAAFFEGHPPPASTWVGVTALVHPDFLIEIEVVASLPA